MIGTIFYPLSRVITAISLFFSTLFGGGGLAAAAGNAPPSLQPLLYPKWIHEHWVYENEGDTDTVRAFVDGFKERGIPVGAVMLDRPWELNDVGTFTPDPDRYWDFACEKRHLDGKPDPNCEDCLLCYFQNGGTKVLLWASCMINESAGDVHAYAKEKGYFLSGGKVIKWWGGNGSMIDYTNPEAVKFWEGQLDKVLNLGIDGFKLDGADPYVMLLLPAYGKSGLVGWKQYQKLQYEHFYNYTKSHKQSNAILTRATDDLIGWGIPLRFMSRDINFSGWTGDRDSDWGGIRQAMNTMFTSAMFNYASYGSEIGGFRGPDEPVKDIFIRWAQLGAFSPVMLNGGGGQYHRPWLYDDETVAVYKKFTGLHYELIPYISSQVMYSYEQGQPTMRPQFGVPYQYMLGDELLVAPFYQESADNTRTVYFPLGDEWIYLFDESKTYKGGGIKKLHFPYEEAPAFIRNGAILPMDDLDGEFTTVRVYPTKGGNSFGLYEEGMRGSTLSYTMGGGLTLKSTATPRALLWRVYGAAEPAQVSLNGTALAKAGSLAQLKTQTTGYCMAEGALWVAVKDAAAGAEIVIK